MHRRLQVSKLCRCLAPKWQPNARLCAAETRRRDGRGRRLKTACSCHWLLWNAHRSKGRAANNDVSAETSRRRCNCLRWLLLMVMLSGCSNHPIFAGGHEAVTLSCHWDVCEMQPEGGAVPTSQTQRVCLLFDFGSHVFRRSPNNQSHPHFNHAATRCFLRLRRQRSSR